ncbi:MULTISPECIES: nuclear transport factor 2 family protein [unclassified Kribbella]|uniref:nuclear transport factor 2 family protein n=1 Tax=unclassified Kribbella TaxID=2644121 RepID=UPI003016025C
MSAARTPEELETLLEDAFVLHDHEALAQLFEPDAVLHRPGQRGEAHGRQQIECLVADLWDHQSQYVANPRAVLQLRGTALIISEPAINVVRRTPDGTWRYAIVYLSH